MDKPQGLQLPDLARIDAGLKPEVKLLEGLDEREMREPRSGAQIAGPAGLDLPIQQLTEGIGIGALILRRPLQVRFQDGVGFGEPQGGQRGMEPRDHGHAPPPLAPTASYTASGRTST